MVAVYARKIEQYAVREGDAGQSTQASLLLRDALMQAGISDYVVAATPSGKPYLTSQTAEILPHISLSHAGQWVVCVLSDEPVGIDVEDLSRPFLRIPERLFSQVEKDYYESATSEQEKMRRFFRIWCARESYVKYTGDGLRAIRSIYVDVPHGQILKNDCEDGICKRIAQEAKNWCGSLIYFEQIPGYMIAVCVKNTDKEPISLFCYS